MNAVNLEIINPIIEKIKAKIFAKLDELYTDPSNNFNYLKINQSCNNLSNNFCDKFYELSPMLAWLKNQTNFLPQFYLNLRDENRVIASLGTVVSFTDLEKAEKFVQAHGQDFMLLGGRKFNGENFFFLPRILLDLTPTNLKIKIFYKPQETKADVTAGLEQINWQLKPLQALPNLTNFAKPQADHATWCQQVEQSIEAIKQNCFSKVVLANAINLEAEQDINPFDFLHHSQKVNLGCYHFLFSSTAGEYFVGSSPERLYSRNQNNVYTEALAGTVKVVADEAETQKLGEWLLNDEKNLSENQFVATSIQQSLQVGCLADEESFKISEIRLKKLRKVQHLQRLITAKLKPNYLDDFCLTQIHPTPAVAGLPKASAIKFIHHTENFNRGWYAGTLGIMSQDFAEFCVAIRSAMITQNQIRIFAGAGIVLGSTPKAEWQEIEYKAYGLISLFPNSQTLSSNK